MPSRGKLGFVLRQCTFSSSVIREKRSSMRASIGTSGLRKGASANTGSDITGLLSRIVSLVAGLAMSPTPTLGSAAESPSTPCVHAKAEAPYRGSGYDHIVKLENQCPKVVVCSVSSDVRPDPVIVSLQPKERTEVLLWRGSPASTFKVRLSCQ